MVLFVSHSLPLSTAILAVCACLIISMPMLPSAVQFLLLYHLLSHVSAYTILKPSTGGQTHINLVALDVTLTNPLSLA